MKRTKKLEFFTTKQLGPILTASPRTLEGWRLRGKGPPFLRLGSAKNAKVVYLRADVELWLSKNCQSVINLSTNAVTSPPNDDGSMRSGPVPDVVPSGSAVQERSRPKKTYFALKKLLGVALAADEAVRRATQWRPRGHE